MLHKITGKTKVENTCFKKNDSVQVQSVLFPSLPPCSSAQGELQGVQEHF